jgi:sensor histidine kinase regulating citrate/malate metabolism
MGSGEDIRTIVSAFFENALTVSVPQEMMQISLSWEKNHLSSMLLFSITDSGPGIPKTLLANLISIQGAQTIAGCTLSRSRLLSLNQLILDQGGYLRIENAVGSGTRVEIHFLPVNG